MMKNIMFIEAHPDDIAISIMGTLLKQLEKGCNIIWITLTSPNIERSKEQYEVVSSFPEITYYNLGHTDGFARFDSDTIRFLDVLVKNHNIDTVFTHWNYSSHQDHQVAHKLAMVISRKTVQNVYMYEAACPSHITYPTFVPNKFFDITDYVGQKTKIIRMYESQVDKYGLDWIKAIEALAKYRGYLAGTLYAESVMVVKEVS